MTEYDTHYSMAVDHYDSFDSNADIENSFYGNEGEHDNLFGIAIGKKARRKKAVKSSRATLEFNRKNADLQIAQDAIDKKLQQSTIALQNVEAAQPLVEKYVASQGMTPQTNPAALSLQATQAFQNQIQTAQAQGIPDYQSAYSAVIDNNYADWGTGEEEDTEEADEFFGSIITSVFKAGQAVVEKINEKRESKGKKPLFAGKNWKKLAEKVANNEPVVLDALSATERAYVALSAKELLQAQAAANTPYNAGKNAFINDQTRQAIKQYLPYVLVIAVIIFLAGKKL